METRNINIIPGGTTAVIHVSQNDVGRTIEFNVQDRTEWFDLAGATVKIQGTKPSGLGYSLEGTISGHTATFVTNKQMTDEHGSIASELKITRGDMVIGSGNFILSVERDPHPDSTTDGSVEELIPQITILVERVEAAAESVLGITVETETLPAGTQATYAYDEATNTATFGIPQGEAGAGSAGVVADAYSASQTYAVGDYVIHNNKLYRCTTAITTAESFTASHWTQIVLSDEASDSKIEINKNSVAISNISDINYTTDVLDGIEWENGTIDASTGENASDNTRRRTVGYIDVDSLESISCNIEDGYKYVLEWYKADETFMPKISVLWYPFASSFAIPSEAKYLRVIVANVDDSTASVGDEQNLSIVGEPSLHYTAKDSEKGKEYMPLVISADDFENGSFSGGNRKSANVNILRLKKPIYCKEGCDVYFDLGDLYFTLWYMDSDDPDTATIYDSISRNRNKHITVPMDCYIFILLSKTKSSADHIPISPTDLEGCSISFIAPPFTENIENELYLGEFVNKSTSATGQSDSTTRISMTNCVALPYGDRTKLKVHINPPYVFAIRCGRVAQNLASNLYWYRDGDEIIFNNHEQYYRVIVAKLTDPDATSSYVYQDLTPSDLKYANLRVEYSLDDDTKDSELYDVNADNVAFFLNSQNTLSASAHGSIGSHPIVVHASDFHGDKDRLERTLRFAERAKADCVVLSGDLVANKPYDRLDWMHELFAKFNGLPIICTGNHEVLDNSYTDEMVYDYMMKDSATKIGNTNGTTYYYTDVVSKKLRIIVCDIYQYGATTRSNTHMSDEQLAYIANALATTPADYGVLMVAHSPCVDVGNLADPNYNTFFQSLRKYGFTHYDINGAPIYDIVDAFIARTSINRTYTQTGSPSSISVSADFSNVPSSVQFIAHLTGHIHEDSVCYLPTTEKQLMLNISCGCAMHGGSSYPYLADDCDITRVPYGKMQDAINVYVIDRGHKIVKITRIGGTKTYDMKDREYMAIPYKD